MIHDNPELALRLQVTLAITDRSETSVMSIISITFPHC